MLKKFAAGLGVASIATAALVAWRGDILRADVGPEPRLVQDDPPLSNNELKQTQKLPITQVVLFNSGVGYFARSGQVAGDARVDLQFSAADINDLIKSLVVHDAGGKSVPLRYDSQEPVEKTLKSFAIDLSANPSYGQILNQMRGQKVEVTIQTSNPALNGLPGSLTGTILGMETAARPHSPTAPTVAEMELLNLACAEGLRSVPLSAVQKVRFLNPTVESELRRALDVVAVGHDSQKKTVHLGFQGQGTRQVKVGYVVENPIWKTSYRLVKDDAGKWRLQAWANVENTSDDDWNDIKLTLVSSRPISFQMDLYPPLYIPRPTVEPALFASLRPPTYGGPITNAAINLPNFGIQGGTGFGGQSGFQGGQNFNPNGMPMNPMFAGQVGFGGGGMGQFGNLGNGNTLNAFNNRYSNSVNVDNNLAKQQRLTFNEMQGRRGNNDPGKPNGEAKAQAQQMGSALTGVDADAMERVRAADELGQPARFAIDQKITLPRQQSIMLPILDEEIPAANVSIYNERVHASRPLLGLKIKNQTKQSLMSGPVTVYEGDQPYSGDARLLDLQPNEERYLSYALDTGIEVKTFDHVKPGPEMTARMENGQLSVQYKMRQTRTYVLVNRSPEGRKVVVEQPVRDGWRLVQPEKPAERTADLYRFEVEVKAGETVKYDVSEELPRIDPFAVTKQADWSGFATSLGLDVWTVVTRAPEDHFLLHVAGDKMNVTHKDRRTTVYHVKNRANEDRVVWLEHTVPAEKMLIGKAEPVEKGTPRYRFKLEIKKGETASYSLTEELRDARPEPFALQTLAGYRTPKPGEEDGPAQRYITELGFEVWRTSKPVVETLTQAKFTGITLMTTTKEVETMVYHVRNRAATPRTFVIDHQLRVNWHKAGDQPGVGELPRFVQFTVAAEAGKTATQPVDETRGVEKREPLKDMTEARVKEFAANPQAKAVVKEAVTQAFAQRREGEALAAALKDLRSQSKEISDEQSRVRGLMEKLPPESELYKRYLKKLDEQETQLEKMQGQIASQVADEKAHQKTVATMQAKPPVE